MPPRRFSTIVLIVVLCVTAFFFLTASIQPAHVTPDLETTEPQRPSIFRPNLPTFDIPKLHFSFQSSAHRPPQQKNSTSGESSWYSDWKWLNPFSSSITLDEDRAVLPPLPERVPVYTYYDANGRKEATVRVDKQLLQTWQRAWWSHGFRPVILGRADAMSHPLYSTLQVQRVPKDLEFELERWLAWGNMGSGLLSSWHCVPMGAYDDRLLSHLRRGMFEQLTRFDGLGAGLFAGEKSHIDEALREALSNMKLNTLKTITEAIGKDRFRNEQPDSIAHYDSGTISAKYPPLAQKLADDPIKGRTALNDIINAHLHTIWQNTFSSGIAVLKPLPAHTSTLSEPAFHLAKLLAECLPSIMQSSCPPNRPRCNPCVGSKMSITTPSAFKNTSSLFTISTVPHPYTFIALNNQTTKITVAHIRRYTDRDPWITEVTKDTLGSGRGGPSRLMSLKDAIASDFGASRSLWFTVEQFPASLNPPAPAAPKSPTNDPHPQPPKATPLPESWLENLDWLFGFPIPRTTLSHGESLPPVPGPERWKPAPGTPVEHRNSYDPGPPTDVQQATEVEVLSQARKVINSKDRRGAGRMKEVAEAWNLADAEAWKFIRAFLARRNVERLKWEEEEAEFGDTGIGRDKSRWWRL